MKAEIEALRRELQRARQPLDAVEAIEEKAEVVEARVVKPVTRKRVVFPAQPAVLEAGKKVRVRSLNLEGVLLSVSGEDAEVQVGNLRVRVKTGDLSLPAMEEPAAPPAAKPVRPVDQSTKRTPVGPFRATPNMELDLRGQRAEDALDALDSYLEKAYMSGMPFVRIIHGKGTGRLRQVIGEALRASPHVRKYEMGGEKEGGDGVTVAHVREE